MVVRRDSGSYRRADANGDSRAARVQYRLGRAAAVLARTVQYECHQRARVSFGRHVGGHGRAVSGVLRPGHRDSAGHVLLRRAAQPLPDREFHPISQPADPVLCGRTPAARTDASKPLLSRLHKELSNRLNDILYESVMRWVRGRLMESRDFRRLANLTDYAIYDS